MMIAMTTARDWVGSNGEKSGNEGDKDNFIVAMAPPAKKAKTHRHVIPRKMRKIVESNKDDEDDKDAVIFAKATKILGNGDPLALD